MQTSERIKVVSLTKRFLRRGGGEVIPVNDVSFSVGDHEMVVLLGPSGCGKTTLLRCIAGLERPDSGQIFIDGEPVFDSSRNLFVPPEKRSVSMVFQSYALWPHMTIFENVAYPLECRGVPAREIRPRVLDALKVTGLDGLDRQYTNQLSGGQQQRVALARALASQTSTVFFDEPLSNVDAKVREQLRTEIQQLQRTLGFTGLYVTHDQIEAMAIAHRIGLLNSGRIEQMGSGQELYWQPLTRYVANFIGTANIWEGVVVSAAAGRIGVRTDFGQLVVEGPTAMASRQVGDKVAILARPEAIRLRSQNVTGATNMFPCLIKDRLFLGANVELNVDISGRNIRVATSPLDDTPSGEQAYAHISPPHLVLLAD